MNETSQKPVTDEMEVESLRKEIELYKEKHLALSEDINKLEQKKQETVILAQQFEARAEKQEKNLVAKEWSLRNQDEKFMEKIRSMQEENQKLKTREHNMKEDICFLKKETEKLEAICSSGVERKMVFKGKLIDNFPRCGINAKHQIRYLVKGGTALIVFEEASVAANIIRKRHHRVPIEECYINVKAEPVDLVVLDELSMDMNRSPRKILVSNLPAAAESEETLLDKLELFFSKSRNGGGEVENREFLEDSRSVILTFAKEGVAPQLVEKKRFDVPFGGKETHQVCVSPSLDGNITRSVMKNLLSNRTVLITGIPDIKDEETIKDLLEIHFQKSTNGGGEVQNMLYCPEGRNSVAVFEDDKDVSS
ncbi:interferon-induced 35 kDa protein isoform X2 [Engystomops pustulosus]|uniref:interferon-induced 35 kDa protein isoform X2 n=1 Tax=Engystomops pustulosus TaxID=76066 RepID=UPI003AFA1E25